MRIFDITKTQEINEKEIDYSLGYVVEDKLLKTHHKAEPAILAKSVEDIVAELKNQGIETEVGGDGKMYEVVKICPNGGKDVKEIEPIEPVTAKEAWDEYEDILVYVPYTAEELQERKLESFRNQRQPILTAFDKWEKAVLRGREKDDSTVMQWYRDLLDLKESAFENVPERVRYYS